MGKAVVYKIRDSQRKVRPKSKMVMVNIYFIQPTNSEEPQHIQPQKEMGKSRYKIRNNRRKARPKGKINPVTT